MTSSTEISLSSSTRSAAITKQNGFERRLRSTPEAPVAQLVARAKDRFLAAGLSRSVAALDAELLARHVLGWERAEYLVRRDELVSAHQAEQLEVLVERRERREPVQYLIGYQEFWGLCMMVSPAVLIPRPETELLVEESLNRLTGLATPSVLDAGTGSGCVAVALGHTRRDAHIIATDSSAPALEVAQANAARHGVRLDVRLGSFVPSDLTELDLIVSNPPYIASNEFSALSPEVADHEPRAALWGGLDGTAALAAVIQESPRALKRGGWLIVEFGMNQESRVRQLAERWGLSIEVIRKDLQQLPRVAVARRS